jgi:two-component sensor histidine kinase/PAS domain-containing protein
MSATPLPLSPRDRRPRRPGGRGRRPRSISPCRSATPGPHGLGALVVEGPGAERPRLGRGPPGLEDLADLAADALICRAEQGSRNLESERLDLAIAAASLGEFEWDIKRDVFTISPRLAKISNIEPGGVIPAEGGDALFPYIHADDRDWVRESIDEQLRETGRYDVEYRRPSPDGREVWNHGAGAALLGPDGEPAYLIGVVQDITERKAEEEQRENLVAELDHRIKNLLAVVQSVAAQSARKSHSLDVFLKTFAGRLKSMSSAHDLLSAARWRGATLARIAAAELGGLAPNQTRWDGPELFLTPRAASALSLALHELAVNAVRYGSLSTENGKVEVVWRRTPEGGFALEWLETGGPPATAPQTKGLRRHGDRGRRRPRAGRLGQDQLSVQRRHRHDPGRRRALADAPPVEPVSAAPERIVETVIAADETIRSGAIAGLKVLIVEDSCCWPWSWRRASRTPASRSLAAPPNSARPCRWSSWTSTWPCWTPTSTASRSPRSPRSCAPWAGRSCSPPATPTRPRRWASTPRSCASPTTSTRSRGRWPGSPGGSRPFERISKSAPGAKPSRPGRSEALMPLRRDDKKN